VRVLITDAGYRHSLCAIRSLGKRGIYIIAGSSEKKPQGFYSKYCSERLIYPDPLQKEQFIEFMLNYVKTHRIDVLLPIGSRTVSTLSKYADKFRTYTSLPIADYDKMTIAYNKGKTVEFAQNLGIRVPRTYDNIREVNNFPVVVKGITGQGNIQYINSFDELSKINTNKAIIQEYIPGEGYGFYALLNNGKLKAFFMHHRRREYPITGGASTSAESWYDDKLKELGSKLLTALSWHGVAMVEFKKDSRDGEFTLMEINPKFWGSLDLSVVSGVDFPYLTTKMAVDGDVETVFDYKMGVKFRWLLPDDFLHLLANPKSLGVFMKDFFSRNTKGNIWLSDLKPTLFQIRDTINRIIEVIKNGNLRYPHKIPKLK